MKRIYILKNKPERIYSTLIYVPGDYKFPLSEKESGVLDKLSEISDIFFIFPKGISKQIDLKKFSMNYSSFGYLDGDTDIEPELVTYSLQYLQSFYPTSYLWVGYTNLSMLDSFEDLDFELIVERIYHNQLTKSVFKWKRLTSDQIANIYMKPKESFYKKFLSIFDEPVQDLFWTHSLDNHEKIIFLRIPLITKLLKFLEKDSVYLKSFENRTFGDLLSSWTFKGDNSTLVLNASYRSLDGIHY